MGNAGLTSPRVLLNSPLQLHFKRANVSLEVTEIVSGWFADGAPLGLTLETFRQVLGLKEQADRFFREFDTDGNQKVDAFEVFSAYAIISAGTVDEKCELIFPIFDFAGNDRLNFDEINIMIHSICRGVSKVCKTGSVDDNDVVEVCQRLFDSHNLPYHKDITKEQVRRWLRSDMEASSLFDIFHNSLAVPDAEAALAEREGIQAAVFSQLSSSLSASAVPPQELLRSQHFRQSLGQPSDETCQKLVKFMGSGSPIEPDVFARVVRAWNVFGVVDSATEGELDVKELPNLLLFQNRTSPTDKDAIKDFHSRVRLNSQGRLTRTAWIEAVLSS